MEQVVKRDLAGWQFPYMLQPRASWAFAVVIITAGLIYLTLLRPDAALDRTPRPPALAVAISR